MKILILKLVKYVITPAAIALDLKKLNAPVVLNLIIVNFILKFQINKRVYATNIF